MADLDAAIRAALDNTEHGDRPVGGMCHMDCCGDGYRCECGLDERPCAAVRAVLDLVRDSRDPQKGDGLGLIVDFEVWRAIAQALGIDTAAGAS